MNEFIEIVKAVGPAAGATLAVTVMFLRYLRDRDADMRAMAEGWQKVQAESAVTGREVAEALGELIGTIRGLKA